LTAEPPETNVVSWNAGKIRLLDQSRLPAEEAYLEIEDCRALADAIREMRVRGAPALGVTAGYGLALTASRSSATDSTGLLAEMEAAAHMLRSTRPTAVNLAWALERVLGAARGSTAVAEVAEAALSEARRIHEEEIEAGRAIGRLGAELVPATATVLTHCNTGALATAGYGTALGVIRAAHAQGKRIHVLVDETRPLLQGARLTAWELQRLGIPFTVIVDGAAGEMMRRGKIDCVIVGADRIAANGDVANKVGTYSLAVLARENGLPFYVAAPTSTIDLSTATGDGIPIEERPADEVTGFAGTRTTPAGAAAANPAFDVTPARYVAAIITERGIARPPYDETLSRLSGSDTRVTRTGASKW
jgi:methylthioribose-1-phosphate isomerase